MQVEELISSFNSFEEDFFMGLFSEVKFYESALSLTLSINIELLSLDNRSLSILDFKGDQSLNVNLILDDGKLMNYNNTENYDFAKFNELGAVQYEFPLEGHSKPAYYSYLMTFLKEHLAAIRQNNFRFRDLGSDGVSYLKKVRNPSQNPIVNFVLSICYYIETCKERCIICHDIHMDETHKLKPCLKDHCQFSFEEALGVSVLGELEDNLDGSILNLSLASCAIMSSRA